MRRATPAGRRRSLTPNRWRLLKWLCAAVVALALSGCNNAPSALAPKGPAAEQLAALWWILLGVGTLVYLVVMLFLFVALFRRRAAFAAGQPRESTANGNWIIVAGGVLMPVVVLSGVTALTFNVLAALAQPPTPATYTIRLTGHQWWWEVQYPDQGAITANEVHIPVGQPVQLELASVDVIHSFWAPELNGKLDMIPGQENTLRLQADHAGRYQVLCAEFCGTQHARMLMWIVVEPEVQVAAWVAQQRQPAAPPGEQLARQGQQIFLNSTCADCHTVRGTAAAGTLGPDLTHVAGRLTLGAGTMPNKLGNLGGWVVDPQHVKPGNLMPASQLSGGELQALLSFLSGLK